MPAFSSEHAARGERTLRVALLLSMWAPLTAGIAVLMSQSSTQLADFVRRTVELVALFVSWAVFRRVHRHHLPADRHRRLERVANLFVAAALLASGTVMLVLALSRARAFEPGGNVLLGLAIAVLGLIVNTWFWRRYARLERQRASAILGAQRDLYRAKAFVDVAVILALSTVALAPEHPATRYVDVGGSGLVAAYLLWSSARTVQRTLRPSA